jgi:hypothetical protein
MLRGIPLSQLHPGVVNPFPDQFFFSENMTQRIILFTSHLECPHKNEIHMCFDEKYLIIVYKMLNNCDDCYPEKTQINSG